MGLEQGEEINGTQILNSARSDPSVFPDLVVIYLGMRVNQLRGLKTLLTFGPKISRSVAERPDGLLLHETMLFSVLPPHGGMRQYWRDFESRRGGRACCRTRSGGRASCATREARGSGMSCTSCAAGCRRSTSTWRTTPSAF